MLYLIFKGRAYILCVFVFLFDFSEFSFITFYKIMGSRRIETLAKWSFPTDSLRSPAPHHPTFYAVNFMLESQMEGASSMWYGRNR